MPRGFRPSRKDTIQPAIEEAFRRAGWSVLSVHAVGGKCPDIFCAKSLVTIAIECKTGKGKRKPHQEQFALEWGGHYLLANDPFKAVEDANEILRKELPF